jgi:hypothetical protein
MACDNRFSVEREAEIFYLHIGSRPLFREARHPSDTDILRIKPQVHSGPQALWELAPHRPQVSFQTLWLLRSLDPEFWHHQAFAYVILSPSFPPPPISLG